MFEVRPPLGVAAALVGFFAIFHGHAHGTELPPGQSAMLYSVGFVVATGLVAFDRYRDRTDQPLEGRRGDAAGGRRRGRSRGLRLPVGGAAGRAHVSRVRAAWRGLAALAALLAASPAQAHLMNSGFGPFYDGLAHPLISPEDLLPAVAVTLLAGLGGARQGRFVLAILPGAWLAGMAAGWAIGLPPAPAWLGAVATAFIGALVAGDPRLPLAAVTALATVLGALHGYDNGRDLAATTGALLAIAGIACSLFAMVSLLAGQVAVLQAQWARLAVRISGSWIAAIGLLMFGWSMRG